MADNFHFLIRATIILSLTISSRVSSEECLYPDQFLPRASLELQDVTLETEGNFNNFYGYFILKNHDIDPGFSLEGKKNDGYFYVEYPKSRLEFKDLNENWVGLNQVAPGSFLAPPDEIFVKMGEVIAIKSMLFSKSETGFSGSDFRLVLSARKNKLCFIS